MKLIYRIAYYLGGFTIGIILLLFFLSGKRTSCDYGPNARTLKNIRTKRASYSSSALKALSDNNLDTAAIQSVFLNGNVLFSESDTRPDSCKIYMVESLYEKKNIKVKVQNCNKEAAILDVFIIKNP